MLITNVLLFWPCFICLSFSIFIFILWRRMFIQQKLFTAIMLFQIPTFLKYALKACDQFSGLPRDVLQCLCSFSAPMILVLAFTYTLTLLWSNQISKWNKWLFVIPFLTLLGYVLSVLVFPTSMFAGDTGPHLFQTLYAILFVGGDLFITIFAIHNIPHLLQNADNNLAEGREAFMPIIKQFIVSLVAFIMMQVPDAIFSVVRVEQQYFWMMSWAVFYSVFAVYLIKVVLYNIFLEVTPAMMYQKEEETGVLLKMMENDADIEYGQSQSESASSVVKDAFVQSDTDEQSIDEEDQPAAMMTEEEAVRIARSKHIEKHFEENHFAQRLAELMDVQELYMQPNLTIAELAQKLGTNQYYLSIYLNDVLCVKFVDYINLLRIERVVLPYLEQHPNAAAADLCTMSGFQHIATFYRAILKCTGMSFPEYKRSLKK